MRFDPTPSSEEEIVTQDGQTLDFAEKLWKDYVVDAQKLNEGDSLYAPVATGGKDAIDNLIRNVEVLRNGFNGRDIFSGRVSFAWPLAILIFLLGALGLGTWRLIKLLPRLAPR